MSSQDLSSAIKSINDSASRANATTDFFNGVLDGGKTESIQNPLTGAVVPSIQKAVYDQYADDINEIKKDVADANAAAVRAEAAAGSVDGPTIRVNDFSLWKRTLADAGLDLVGTFGDTLTISSAKKAMLHRPSAKSYEWTGATPKNVTSSDQPTDAGWSEVTKILRSDVFRGGVARGDDGYNFALSGAAFRRYAPDSTDWKMVTDATHIPVNTYSVTNGVSVEINYKGSKIGSLICGPDESFAMDGVSVGGSVGPNRAIISMGAPCSFLVDFDSANAITADNRYFDQARFGCTISGGGQISITHPQRRLMLYPIVQHYASLSTNEKYNVHYVSSPGTGGFTCFLIGEAEGQISYSGTKWSISSSMWDDTEVAMTYDAPTGTLTVTHPVVLGSPGLSVDPMWNGSPVNVQAKDISSTGFKVVFTKPDGTFPSQSSALGVLFTRGMSGIVKKPSGKMHVFLGNVQVNMNHVSYQFGNFWTVGLMRDDTI